MRHLSNTWLTLQWRHYERDGVSNHRRLDFVYLTRCSGADQRKHQSSASLVFVRGIHRWPVNSPHKGSVTRKMFPFDDVIMYTQVISWLSPFSLLHQIPLYYDSVYHARDNFIKKAIHIFICECNSLCLTVWHHPFGRSLDQARDCCLTLPSHYHTWCWLNIRSHKTHFHAFCWVCHQW